MNDIQSTSRKARAFVVRAVVLSLLAVTLATSLGACVYPYGEGGGGPWHEGGGWRWPEGGGGPWHEGGGWHEGDEGGERR